MDFVTPFLAVGTGEEAANAALRRQFGIGAVLSLLPVDFVAGEHHATLPIADRQPLPAAMIAAAGAFIADQIAAGRKVLLHCQMGISRSPAIAAGYLHTHAGLPLTEALAQVRRVRPIADPHPALLASLSSHCAAPAEHDAATSIDLSANENPLGPSPRALEAIHAAAANCHRYPDRNARALRAALAQRWLCQPEQIVLGNGSCELLDLAARAFLAPGDEAIIAVPSFMPYRSAVRKAHGRAVTVPLRDFEHDLEAMAARVTEKTRLVFLGNPNNPTGSGIDGAALVHFLDALPPHVVVVLDEAYREYASDARNGEAADSTLLVAAGRRVVVVRTFSKIYGLAGLRIGYAIASAELTQTMEALRPHYNTSSVAQAAALAALGDEAHVTASRTLATAGRAQLTRGCAALGLPVVPSAANFLLVRVGAAPAVAGALAGRGILVKSGEPFGLPDYLRVTVGLASENYRFLAELATVLTERLTEEQAKVPPPSLHPLLPPASLPNNAQPAATHQGDK